ncbi:hypothetical protein B0H17DRAFT_1181689 [Mycena rosella]|uniref:Uncharacterized protein n=1 Tax=Mycena rosella TaxID=1033263 RepID=A0AAD7D7V4_MYCRO|nr:hypothetical protein B0H17DRAFT_1181689 [Mycena rosella]
MLWNVSRKCIATPCTSSTLTHPEARAFLRNAIRSRQCVEVEGGGCRLRCCEERDSLRESHQGCGAESKKASGQMFFHAIGPRFRSLAPSFMTPLSFSSSPPMASTYPQARLAPCSSSNNWTALLSRSARIPCHRVAPTLHYLVLIVWRWHWQGHWAPSGCMASAAAKLGPDTPEEMDELDAAGHALLLTAGTRKIDRKCVHIKRLCTSASLAVVLVCFRVKLRDCAFEDRSRVSARMGAIADLNIQEGTALTLLRIETIAAVHGTRKRAGGLGEAATQSTMAAEINMEHLDLPEAIGILPYMISHHCLHLSSSFVGARPSPRRLLPELSPMNSLTCTRKCGALLTYVMGISETMTCDQFMRWRERGRDERSSCRRSDNAEYLPNIAGEIEGQSKSVGSCTGPNEPVQSISAATFLSESLTVMLLWRCKIAVGLRPIYGLSCLASLGSPSWAPSLDALASPQSCGDIGSTSRPEVIWDGRSRLMNNGHIPPAATDQRQIDCSSALETHLAEFYGEIRPQLTVPAFDSAPLCTQYANLTARRSIESHRTVLLLWVCHPPSVRGTAPWAERLAILNLDLPSMDNSFLELKVVPTHTSKNCLTTVLSEMDRTPRCFFSVATLVPF